MKKLSWMMVVAGLAVLASQASAESEVTDLDQGAVETAGGLDRTVHVTNPSTEKEEDAEGPPASEADQYLSANRETQNFAKEEEEEEEIAKTLDGKKKKSD